MTLFICERSLDHWKIPACSILYNFVLHHDHIHASTMLTEFVLLTLLTGLIAYLISNRPPKGFPPGPWPIPLLGAIPFLGKYPYRTALAWKSKYGPVIGLDFVGHHCVIISDNELLKQCANEVAFSGRPSLPFIRDRSEGHPEGIIFTSGRKWQEQKRFTLRKLRDFGFGTRSMESIVHEEIQELIERFKQEEGKPISTQNKFNAAIVNALWTIVAGERFRQDDPQLNKLFEMFTQDLNSLGVLAQLAAFIPWVSKYIPDWITGYSKIMGPTVPINNFIRPYIDSHMSSHLPNQPRDFMDAYIDEMKATDDPASSFHVSKPKSLIYAILDLFVAGGETTSTSLTWIFLFMARNRHVQEKLQAEIDRVVGNSRLPSLADRADMPYTEAVIHEVMRARPLVPLTMQCTTEDVNDCGGYKIPKDTIVMMNLFSSLNDPAIWGDPENFRPERFLSKDESKFVHHDGFVTFSLGKRVCLGERLARDELFLFVASLFQTFDVRADPGSPPPTLESTTLGMMQPEPHKLVLKVRV